MDIASRRPNAWVFAGVFIFSSLLPFAFYKLPRDAAGFGDTFGFMAAATGALALFYLSCSVWLQARANRSAARSIQAQAKLVAMGELAEHLRSLIANYRAWEHAAGSEAGKAKWRKKKQEVQRQYSGLMYEIRKLADIDMTFDLIDDED